jgi:hypothetical protein
MGGVVSALVGASRKRQSRKRKQFNTVELKMRMDCDGCELKVRNTFAKMRGMTQEFIVFFLANMLHIMHVSP